MLTHDFILLDIDDTFWDIDKRVIQKFKYIFLPLHICMCFELCMENN